MAMTKVLSCYTIYIKVARNCMIVKINRSVLIGYPVLHFEADEKPKGGPLEIEIFFVEGG